MVLLAGTGGHLRVRAMPCLPGAPLLRLPRRAAAVSADSAELAAAKQLLDAAKDQDFRFQRIASGPDGPLRGLRQTPNSSMSSTSLDFGNPTHAPPSDGVATR
jgi:hypothetical protein